MFLTEKLYKKMKVTSVFLKKKFTHSNKYSVLAYRQIHMLCYGETPHGIG